jgi:hypothetical protein
LLWASKGPWQSTIPLGKPPGLSSRLLWERSLRPPTYYVMSCHFCPHEYGDEDAFEDDEDLLDYITFHNSTVIFHQFYQDALKDPSALNNTVDDDIVDQLLSIAYDQAETLPKGVVLRQTAACSPDVPLAHTLSFHRATDPLTPTETAEATVIRDQASPQCAKCSPYTNRAPAPAPTNRDSGPSPTAPPPPSQYEVSKALDAADSPPPPSSHISHPDHLCGMQDAHPCGGRLAAS